MSENAVVGRKGHLLMLILVGWLAIGTFWAAGVVEASPTWNRLTDLLGEHHYHQALSQATALLNLSHRGRVSKGVSRYDLLEVKGEALLGLKLFDSAVDTYRSMATLAPTIREARIARATADLISRSVAGYYAPQHRTENGLGPVRIDIVPRSSRQEAIRAFYHDQWVRLKPRITAALQRSELGPLLRLFVPLRRAVDAESAAKPKTTHATDDSLQVSDPAEAAVDSSTDRIVVLTTRGLRRMEGRIKAIVTSSNTLIFFRRRTAPRGVTQPQVNELQNMIQTCRDILAMIAHFKQVFPDFPKDCSALRHLKSRTLHVEHLAQNTLPAG